MIIIDRIPQGSEAWHAHRASSRNASEAPAIMGESTYLSRNELLRQKATGYTPDVDPAKQRLFDRGHETEAAARAIVEEELGESFFPVVGTTDDGYLSASLDGMNMAGDTIFEHKLFNASLAEAVRNEDLQPMYYWQLEQQLLVSGAEKVIFVCSDGTRNNWEQMEYRPIGDRAARLLAAWRQFDEDLANFTPVEVIPPPMARNIEDLPALSVQIVGRVSASNLAEWQDIVTERIQGINTELTTDQHFVDADKMVKFLKDGELKIDLVKSQAQAQVHDIDTLFRTLDSIKAEMRSKRLELDSLIKSRKEAIRGEIMNAGKLELAEHIGELNKRLGTVLMPAIAADFAGVMKGKKTVESLKNAVSTELARAKVDADMIASRIETNLATLSEHTGHSALFYDKASLVLKDPDDLKAIITARIHEATKEQEAKEPAKAEVTPAAPPASTPVTTAAIEPIAAAVAPTETSLVGKIVELLRVMSPSDQQLVLHYCERLQLIAA